MTHQEVENLPPGTEWREPVGGHLYRWTGQIMVDPKGSTILGRPTYLYYTAFDGQRFWNTRKLAMLVGPPTLRADRHRVAALAIVHWLEALC